MPGLRTWITAAIALKKKLAGVAEERTAGIGFPENVPGFWMRVFCLLLERGRRRMPSHTATGPTWTEQ